MKNVLQIHPDDNVLVALTDLHQGEQVNFGDEMLELKEDVPAKHKLLVQNLPIGGEVIMYGVLVGKAVLPIRKGERLTTANILHASQEDYSKKRDLPWKALNVSGWENRTFKGYHRDDGRVGTMNYWLFIPMVFCENRNLIFIREALNRELGYAPSDKYKLQTRRLVNLYKNGQPIPEEKISDLLEMTETLPSSDRVFPNIDGIKFLNHEGGCGGTRQDSELLGKLLAGYADHPNVAGVTVLSLGCQNLQIDQFKGQIFARNPDFKKPLLLFEQQKADSEEEMINRAIRETFLELIKANKIQRSPAPLSKLCVGVKCGGSDGFSGISANPAVGYTSDLLVSLGASVVLAEFPELFGVEQELVDRCVSQETASKFTRLMKSYQAQAEAVGSGFDMNPSPGNIRDGLITDAMKSAGAARKGGTSPIVEVLDYTEPVKKKGLHLLCTPGNDVEATTGKTGSGTTLILFTTGLGTPTGNPICPTIKISTNHALTRRMGDIIDIDTGGVITGEKTLDQMGEEILEYCIRAASGEITPKAVQLNQDDFIPWKRGVSL
ncbi:MAG: UxaA family hydrolase [Chitinophagaceae bacterium]